MWTSGTRAAPVWSTPLRFTFAGLMEPPAACKEECFSLQTKMWIRRKMSTHSYPRLFSLCAMKPLLAIRSGFVTIATAPSATTLSPNSASSIPSRYWLEIKWEDGYIFFPRVACPPFPNRGYVPDEASNRLPHAESIALLARGLDG